MSDEPAIGGSGQSGQALRDALRSTQRGEEQQAQRLLDGSAMRDLLAAIERASDHLLAYPIRETAHPGELRAQAMSYLLGLVTTGIAQTTRLSDPDFPRLVRNPDSDAKWGAENVDNQYLWCRVSPESQYLVRGDRSNVFEALLETKDGYMQLGDDAVFDTLLLSDCECDEAGRFEILLAAERPFTADERRAEITDVANKVLSMAQAGGDARVDAIIFDLYKGPHHRTDKRKDPLYGSRAIENAKAALKPDGVFAIWGENYDEGFAQRLQSAGFAVRSERPGRGGYRHVVFLATLGKGQGPAQSRRPSGKSSNKKR